MRTALFLEGPSGPLFAYHRCPAGPVRGAVLLVPPFAEELNKSRRMLSLAAEALGAAGHASLLLDLYGTGDSAGDFGAAAWDGWCADLDAGADWLAARGTPVDTVLALRSGALLAGHWLQRQARPLNRLLLWQPVTQGDKHLTQFLRLRSMAAKLQGREEPVKDLRARLSAGEALEIAGYTLSPALAEGLSLCQLAELQPPMGTAVHAFELGPVADAASPALAAVLEIWRAAGLAVEGRCLAGEPFWSAQEIATCPALIEATLAALAGETA